jgi:hypothetical protein
MSRYTDTFNTHPFQAKFKDLTRLVIELKLGDISQTNYVSEILRLKKVIEYLNDILNSLDPELVPLTIWDSYLQQTQSTYSEVANFISNNNIAHINNANSYVDNLLNLVRPYLLLKGKAKSISENLFAVWQKNIKEYLDGFQDNANEKLSKMDTYLEAAKNNLANIDNVNTSVDGVSYKLFGDNKNGGVSHFIDEAQTSIANQKAEIDNLYTRLLVDAPKQPSIQTELETAREIVEEEKSEVLKIKSEVETEVADLTNFYVKIFGKLNDKEEKVGGLSNEITDRLSILRDLESTNKIRYDAIIENIESLVPSATSAGLAKAYQDMKLSFKDPIKWSSLLFYASIFLLIFFSYISAVSFDITHSKDGYEITYGVMKYASIEEALRLNFFKIPLWASLVWIAVFASKRRSEFQRLQQEYAHKEAFAASYISYKQQIEALNKTDTKLQDELISKMIDAISFNASQTLDGKHGDSHPIQAITEKLLEKFGDMKLTDLLDILKKTDK